MSYKKSRCSSNLFQATSTITTLLKIQLFNTTRSKIAYRVTQPPLLLCWLTVYARGHDAYFGSLRVNEDETNSTARGFNGFDPCSFSGIFAVQNLESLSLGAFT